MSDILEDAQTEGDIFPEETGVKIQSDLLSVGALDWYHGEWNPAVAYVGVKDSLQARGVTDLALIHAAYAILDGHHLAEVQVRVPLQESGLGCLDLIIEDLNLICAHLVEAFVEQGHILRVEGSFSVPIFEKAVNSAWMDDLVARAQSETEEVGHGN